MMNEGMTPTSESKKRRRRRTSSRVDVRVAAVVTAGEAVHEALCVNLSTGGLALQLEQPPMPGETVAVVIAMPNGENIDAQAEVVHTGARNPDEVGARFVNLDQGALMAIHSFVAEQLERVLSLGRSLPH